MVTVENTNRASKADGTVTDTYHYDDADKLTSITEGATTVKSYGYDAAGNTTSVVTSAGTTTLGYDYECRLTGITYPSTATNSFTYNGLDTRVGKVDSGGTRTFRRDGANVTDPVLSDGSLTYTPGISTRSGSTTKFDHLDRLGSVVRQSDTSQASTSLRRWDAFGLLKSTSGTASGPFGFVGGAGYQSDSDSGLMLLGHRYYDASIGRFLSRDPAKDGRNWYTYCDNNPLGSVDVQGYSVGAVIGGFVGAAIGLAILPVGAPVLLTVVIVGIWAGSGSAIGGRIGGDPPKDTWPNFRDGALGGILPILFPWLPSSSVAVS